MILRFGDYQHVDGECNIRMHKEAVRAGGHQAATFIERWDVEGFLQGVGNTDAEIQADLFARITQLKQVYAIEGLPNRHLRLLKSDGSATPHAMDASLAIGGLRVVISPSFPEGKLAELSTFRTYNLAVEGEFPDTTVGYLEWSESLRFFGGGPMDEHLECLVGLPQKQRTKEATTYHAIQMGKAVGQFAYPMPPAPIWPDAMVVPSSDFMKELPERYGPPGNPSYMKFPVTWHYEFKSSQPLDGNPNGWPY